MFGKNVLVGQFEVADGASKGLTQKDEEGLICEIPYEEFRAKLPADKVSRYDNDMILIQPMTGEELRAIYSSKEQ